MKKAGKLKMSLDRKIFIIGMLSIPLIKWAIFWTTTNFGMILLAFKHPRTGEFAWINFKTIFDSISSTNGALGISLKNTFLYFFWDSIVLFVLNLIMAYILFKQVWGHKVFRIIFYLPAIISSIAMTTVFTEFIKTDGPLNLIYNFFGGTDFPERGLLGQVSTATATIIVYTFWVGFTGNLILFSSALARIPIEILESARLDGCGSVRELVNIIVPLIFPTISTMMILSLTGIFGAGGPILLFTNGDYNTSTLGFWIFQQVYGNGAVGGTGNYGPVSAAGLVFTLIGFPIIMVVKWLLDKVPAVEY